ncbi:hypothetical protein ACOSP7_022206 [Xanthoceras sorbifolium]
MPKIKLFIWRACLDLLPAKVNLITHKVPVDPLCPLCLAFPETTMHALWSCHSLEFIKLFDELLCNLKASGAATVFVPKLQREPPLVRWRAPSLGWLKLNTDPAFDSYRRRLGFGVVICDSKGLVMLSGSLVFDGFFSPEIAEAMAILRGVQLALEMGFSPICI